jgi:hypothetical protein
MEYLYVACTESRLCKVFHARMLRARSHGGKINMTPEEFVVPGAEPEDMNGDFRSVWVETRWGLAAVVIAACLVALGAFYYVVACMTIP